MDINSIIIIRSVFGGYSVGWRIYIYIIIRLGVLTTTTIITNNTFNTNTIGGEDWTMTSAPWGYWLSIASSSSGQYLAAGQGTIGGYIYTSSSGQ